ncbi:MAG: hypothetical protein WC788_02295 [Candidatus Paceibacterota bacterium]
MDKVILPHKLRNGGRNVYYSMFSAAAKEAGLSLDRGNYPKVILLSGNRVVAIVDSDAQIGEPDDLTNEFNPGGCNNRTYNGLKIRITDKEFEENLNDLVLILKAILKEEVALV